MSKHSGLGRGLESLISSSEFQYEETLPENSRQEGAIEVAIGAVKPNPWQPRKAFDKDKLAELADSIKKHGIIQPLIVRKKGINYELVAGERRLRAAKLAHLKKVPVLVREYDETQMRELALVENIQRHDLNPLEEAKAIQEMIKQHGYTQVQAAERIGRSRAALANILRLLNLPEELQTLVAEEKLAVGQIRPVLALNRKEQQLQVGMAMLEHGWSARTVEEVVKALKEGKELRVLDARVETAEKSSGANAKKTSKKQTGKNSRMIQDVHLKEFEEHLIDSLGTKVRIVTKNDSVGKIEIDYYSMEDLDRLCELLQGKKEKGRAEAQPWLTPKFSV